MGSPSELKPQGTEIAGAQDRWNTPPRRNDSRMAASLLVTTGSPTIGCAGIPAVGDTRRSNCFQGFKDLTAEKHLELLRLQVRLTGYDATRQHSHPVIVSEVPQDGALPSPRLFEAGSTRSPTVEIMPACLARGMETSSTTAPSSASTEIALLTASPTSG